MKNQKQKGVVLITTLVVITIIGIMLISLTGYYIYDQGLTKRQIFDDQAMYLTLSGINFYQQNSNPTPAYGTTEPSTATVSVDSQSDIKIWKPTSTEVRIKGIFKNARNGAVLGSYTILWNTTTSSWKKL